MYAIKHKKVDLVKFLLKNCLGDGEIKITDKNNKGMTALHLAIVTNDISLVRLILIGDHKDEKWVDNTI
jgi:ankyrin repeat protein